MSLLQDASLVFTDSGGIQEETTFLGIPCLTLRPNTERPVTIEEGTNILFPLGSTGLREYAEQARDGQWKKGRIPEGWDGHAADRIAEDLVRRLA